MIRGEILPPLTTPPKQARSQARLERILDSAETLFARDGFENASIAKIMHGASSSVGIFYQRFHSKEELFEAVVTRFTDQSIATVDRLFNGDRPDRETPAQTIHRVMPILVAAYRHKKDLLRAILLRASAVPSIHAKAHRAEKHIEQALERILFKGTSCSASSLRQFRLGYQMIRSTLNILTIYNVPDRAGLDLDDPDLAHQLTEAFLRIVGVKRPTLTSPSRSITKTRKSQKRRTP
jgi:AcrR family transcriptional regulator